MDINAHFANILKIDDTTTFNLPDQSTTETKQPTQAKIINLNTIQEGELVKLSRLKSMDDCDRLFDSIVTFPDSPPFVVYGDKGETWTFVPCGTKTSLKLNVSEREGVRNSSRLLTRQQAKSRMWSLRKYIHNIEFQSAF